MASVITATTTSGLTQSADNSGVLQLASGTGNLVTVPSVTGTAMVSGNMPAFIGYGNANLSISSATFTKVPINVVEYDTNSNFSNSTYRFTATIAGYYQVNGSISYETSSSITRFLSAIYRNGSEYKRGGDFNLAGIQTTISSVVYLGVGDYVELYGYATGTGLIFKANSTYAMTFSVAMIRTA